MSELDDALDHEIRELETVLLRLTTLRLLMASGKHGLVDRAAAELEGAMAGYEAAERVTRERLARDGVESLREVADRCPEAAPELERRAGALHAIARDVRVAMATTAAAAERSLQAAHRQAPGPAVPALARSRHPFVVEI